MSSRHDHVQAGDNGCSHLGLGRTVGRLHHRGGEGAVLGVPSAVLRVDRRVVRHDNGSDPREGTSDRPAFQKDIEEACEGREQARRQEGDAQRGNRSCRELHIVLSVPCDDLVV